MMAPMAATVAGAEPDTAPKNMHAMTVTIPREPVTPPMIELAALTRRLDSPPVSMMVPEIMKKGRARLVKLATPPYVVWAMNELVVTGSTFISTNILMNIATAMGTPRNMRPNITINITPVATISPLPSQQPPPLPPSFPDKSAHIHQGPSQAWKRPDWPHSHA